MVANRSASKSAAAFRTISEVSDELEVPQHVLRFWETKFTQVRPMKRGGGRRYYRPEDIELLRRIRDLLYSDGYTIKGVQKLLREGQVKPPAHEQAVAEQERAGAPAPVDGSALEADTAPEAAAGAQASGQAPAEASGQASGQASGHPTGPPAGQAAAQRPPQTGRSEGPAARAATATHGARKPGSPAPQSQASPAQASPAQESPAQESLAQESSAQVASAQDGAGQDGAGQAPAQPAAHGDLGEQKRETLRGVLDELRAARAELKRRTGE